MKKVVVVFFISILAGCKIHIDSSDNSCGWVQNSDILSGSLGSRPVYLVSESNTDVIGYDNNNVHVPHSICTAAKVVKDLETSTYSWFQYGQAIENSTVHSILFYRNRFGQASSLATRLEKVDVWQEQNVENGLVTRQMWLTQPNLISVEVKDNFNGDGVKTLIAETENAQKTVTWNKNTRQYDCQWLKDGVVSTVNGCFNEAAKDRELLGFVLDSQNYFNILARAEIVYETNHVVLDEQIRYYF